MIVEPIFLEPGQGLGLSPKVKTLWLVRRVVWCLIYMVGLSVLLYGFLPGVKSSFPFMSFLKSVNPMVYLSLWFVIVHLPGLLFLRQEFERWRYKVSPEYLSVSYGFLARRQTTLPLAKLQHIEFESGFFETRMNIVNVQVHNAGSQNTIVIPGVPKEQANHLRDEVMRLKSTINESV